MPDYSILWLQDMARASAARYGVPESLFLWQIGQESSWNPNAYNYNNGGTPAIGIAQFQPPTARQYGVDPYDPVSSLDGAARYDAELYNKYGSWESALRHYGTIHNSATAEAAANALAGDGTLGGARDTLNKLAKSLLDWSPSGIITNAAIDAENAVEGYAQRITIGLLGIVLIGGGVLMFALSTDTGRAAIGGIKSAVKTAGAAVVLA